MGKGPLHLDSGAGSKFSGLRRRAYPNEQGAVSSGAIDKLNKGEISCSSDMIMVYSAGRKLWFLLYQSGKKSEAVQKLEEIDQMLEEALCDVTLDNQGRLLGVMLNLDTLAIAEINDGLLRNHNHEHPERVVSVGDRIMAINGARLTSMDDYKRLLTSSEKVTVRFSKAQYARQFSSARLEWAISR